MKVIGTTKITIGRKIALISDVAKKLDAKEGDIIVFEEDEQSRIFIRKG